MASDFNEPLVDEDKFGGRGVSINRSLLFKECLDKCSMVDLGFSGPRYTLKRVYFLIFHLTYGGQPNPSSTHSVVWLNVRRGEMLS